jgi:hypothetical protein
MASRPLVRFTLGASTILVALVGAVSVLSINAEQWWRGQIHGEPCEPVDLRPDVERVLGAPITTSPYEDSDGPKCKYESPSGPAVRVSYSAVPNGLRGYSKDSHQSIAGLGDDAVWQYLGPPGNSSGYLTVAVGQRAVHVDVIFFRGTPEEALAIAEAVARATLPVLPGLAI